MSIISFTNFEFQIRIWFNDLNIADWHMTADYKYRLKQRICIIFMT
jgi:hypothetical protein